ncbi:SusC/RagA family TonB-linked outer membrane protein [Pedobacter sp. BMA]|uniref:SusC/RagA family TonB-linked outer membrane protein n=1 Tax=Pedobacter sp. BMA TaxID=1663685 RepID=UPI00064B3AE3|nr:SusC/RagA family TonB-linked outer membrane protein [Pedobacter sp. BMA]KLT64801.1 hypothetical protein AB669_13785 [Pedobacter sp. BMA]
MKKTYSRYLFRLLLLFSLTLSITSYAQVKAPEKTAVSINVVNRPLAEVLTIIEKQSGYKFNYDQTEVNINQTVSIKQKSTLKQTLDGLAGQLGLAFNINGNYISIRKGPKASPVQTRSISGLVTDAKTGGPMPGVNVFIKGTRQGAVTDANGKFVYKLNGNSVDNLILTFNFVGMKTQEIKVGNENYFNVKLEDDALGMDEVVVTGSYTSDKRREEVVGSIEQITAERLQTDRPIESFDKMLEGLAAGVQVETTTELNTPVRINIRGIGSLPTIGSSRTTSSQPLYVIDGIPAYEQQKGNEGTVFNNESYLNPLSNINPDDINTISILKDATASALYGANAANGVIIITTKRGTIGKTTANFSYDTGISSFINEYKWLSGSHYYSLLREAYMNAGTSATQASQLAGSKTINTDWFELTQRDAVYQNAGIDISGGANKTSFRFSSGYRKQEATSIGNDLQKIYARLRVDHQQDRLKLGFNLNPTFTKSSNLSNYGGVTLVPNISPYAENGTYQDIQGVPNPLAILEQNENRNQGIQLQASANASYQITKEILISGTFGADNYQNKQTQYFSANNATGRNVNGRLEIYDRNYLGYIGFLQAGYDKTYKKHTVNFLIGSQVENKDTDLLRGAGTGFTFDRLRTLGAASLQTSASSTSSSATISYYSQLGYDFDKKYFANFNGRLDKSSIFGGDKQIAFNGSAGLAWLISNEDFLKGNRVLSSLKLRATYGSTGNSRIGNYSARGLYSFGTSSGDLYNGNVASYPESSSAPNPDLGWEKNHKLNFGLDFTLFKKVRLTAEYFNNTIIDLISSVNVPLETGYSTISANTGKMRNSGFELSVNSEIIETKNLNWNLAFNLGTVKNTILSFNNGYSALYSTAADAAALRVGNSANAIYGYQWAGVDPQTGTERFYDANGQIKTASEINALPITSTSVLANRLPSFQGGMVNSFRLKNFTFSFNILYSYGASKLVNYIDEGDGRNLQSRNQSVNLVDRWQKAGDITDIPKLLIVRSIVPNSSRYLIDISYIKLSNISAGYQIPNRIARKLHLNSASVFANATNLFYWYKDSGIKGRNGVAEKRFTYPETSALTAGIKVGL